MYVSGDGSRSLISKISRIDVCNLLQFSKSLPSGEWREEDAVLLSAIQSLYNACSDHFSLWDEFQPSLGSIGYPGCPLILA